MLFYPWDSIDRSKCWRQSRNTHSYWSSGRSNHWHQMLMWSFHWWRLGPSTSRCPQSTLEGLKVNIEHWEWTLFLYYISWRLVFRYNCGVLPPNAFFTEHFVATTRLAFRQGQAEYPRGGGRQEEREGENQRLAGGLHLWTRGSSFCGCFLPSDRSQNAVRNCTSLLFMWSVLYCFLNKNDY